MLLILGMQQHDARQITQFAKRIHNSSQIRLVSLCRVLWYTREDRCGSKALWDPDGTFLTIRFGLSLENYSFPVCDTNVSSSASNETTPSNENLKNKFSVCLRVSSISLSWFKLKAIFLLWCLVNHVTKHCMLINDSFKNLVRRVKNKYLWEKCEVIIHGNITTTYEFISKKPSVLHRNFVCSTPVTQTFISFQHKYI